MTATLQGQTGAFRLASLQAIDRQLTKLRRQRDQHPDRAEAYSADIDLLLDARGALTRGKQPA